MRFNKWDGVVPETSPERTRAKHAGLGTLAPSLCGKSCASCEYYDNAEADVAFCRHDEVQQVVAAHQGCRYWENKSLWLPVK